MSHTVAITKGCETLIINLKRVQSMRYWSAEGREHLTLNMNTPDLVYEYSGAHAKVLFEELQRGLTPVQITLETRPGKEVKPERLC